MKIVFRVDASQWIGIGHLSRCLALAYKLKDKHSIIFVTGDLMAKQLIEAKGYRCLILPEKELHIHASSTDDFIVQLKKHVNEDALETIKALAPIKDIDWIIVDHYAIDEQWHRQLRPYTKKIMVIDDLANRQYDCDLLLDQNYFQNYLNRYDQLVPSHCKLLLGPSYMLFRDEFIFSHSKGKRIRKDINRVLVFYGGSDATNETLKAIEAIVQLKLSNIHVDIVTGQMNKQKEHIKTLCSQYSYMTYHEQIDYMEQLMAQADLALGAGGATTWERAILGLPAIVTILADNQRQGIRELEEFGFLENIGYYTEVTPSLLASKLSDYMNASKLEAMSYAAYKFFDNNAQFTNQVVKELC